MSTIIVASLFLGWLVAETLLWALFLLIGLRWAKVKNITTRRVAYATLFSVLLTILACITYLILSNDDIPALILPFAYLFIIVLIPCLVIMQVFKASFFRAVQSWLPTLLAPVIMIGVQFLVLRPFLINSFKTPTNAMAPTLLGNHCKGVCAECGNIAFYTPIRQYSASLIRPLMICRDNFHMTKGIVRSDKIFNADYFFVSKFLRPRRWDIIVFHFPENPSILHVKRLVGLPGEEITIKDGQVWANSKKLTPPDSIRSIKYSSPFQSGTSSIWGSPDRPAKLADDEYFVLGDFSQQSEDSRFWKRGAPGHNTFAVPESYLYGVVTHIYWPPSRWQIFR